MRCDLAPVTRAENLAARAAERCLLAGRVQGVGLRPAVARLAAELDLAGCVRNTAAGVELVLEGAPSALAAFHARLAGALSAAARVDAVRRESLPARGLTTFDIAGSPSGESTSALGASVSPDRAVCQACRNDAFRPTDRRDRYPFTSCAECGPRYSIVDSLPFDRVRTAMAGFALCATCQREYASFGDRRFHAQTIACPECGPNVWLADAADRMLGSRDEALRGACAALCEGRIVAMKGIGGYQLLVDATDESAVARLRARKRRPAKPLAVLVDSLATAERIAILDATERAVLDSPENPIVIARRRGDATLAPGVCGAFDTIGLLLPGTPLHAVLARDAARPLVCTSGNVEGQPLEFEPAAAARELAGIADLWLHHDRPIRRPIDDSVVRVAAGQTVVLRLARGLAPHVLPLKLPEPLVALGGHQHAAFAIFNGAQAVLAPHVGDLESLAAREHFVAQLADLQRLYGLPRAAALHDLHPGYFTTGLAAARFAGVSAVQHHYAHVAATLLDVGWLEAVAGGASVLGVALDGTGWGADGGVWGGEFLVTRGAGCDRVASLRAFPLPGGETAVREPWRTAVALVHDSLGENSTWEKSALATKDDRDRRLATEEVLQIAKRPRWSPRCTSAGRLYDAVAAIVLGCRRAAFDGEPAMLLEAACDRAAVGAYPFALEPGPFCTLDWRPTFRALLADKAAGESPGAMAMRFHRGLAEGVAAVCHRFCPMPVALGGGVFQNRVLVEELLTAWRDPRQPLGLPRGIPPGDGGLAAGQLAVAFLRAANGAGKSLQAKPAESTPLSTP